MNFLVTGGAGFIGRWVVKNLLERQHRVVVIDDFSNGCPENLAEFAENVRLANVVTGDVRDTRRLAQTFDRNIDICIHLAARINVHASLIDPATAFGVDVQGTFNILEEARKHGSKIVFVSTCMVYDSAGASSSINERHPTKPASPYAGAKLAAEKLVQAYYHAYGLPAVIIRPFNTYGPCQKAGGEGGVVSVFLQRHLQRLPLLVYGDGTQTRDLLYVEDCAELIARAALSESAIGAIINAGTGRDIAIKHLAARIAGRDNTVQQVPHPHPRSEIAKLTCDAGYARELLGWEPKASLGQGLELTRSWLQGQMNQAADSGNPLF